MWGPGKNLPKLNVIGYFLNVFSRTKEALSTYFWFQAKNPRIRCLNTVGNWSDFQNNYSIRAAHQQWKNIASNDQQPTPENQEPTTTTDHRHPIDNTQHSTTQQRTTIKTAKIHNKIQQAKTNSCKNNTKTSIPTSIRQQSNK